MNYNGLNIGVIMMAIFLMGCTSVTNKKENTMNSNAENEFPQGTFGYDLQFLKSHELPFIELSDPDTKASLIVAPGLQGRVLTSSANGNEGKSFGWINYKLIESGQVNNKFNPYGGEERFWLGPEGGPFSLYFAKGAEQVFSNWMVPPVLDTEAYEVKEQDSRSIQLVKNTVLKNASGTEFQIGIERRVSLLSPDTLSALLGLGIPSGLEVVAYQTDNTITNMGQEPWTREKGLPSIWLLCMFNPSPTTTVFIPYKQEAEGVIVNDEYFGKVPSDRLIVDKGTAYFKIDGKLRSKIGLPPERAKELCGSFDSEKNILTLLWCTIPAEPALYVNSKWGEQDDPYRGDVINSYNDGPVEDGSIMGPFYEIETSSPAAALQPGESLSHVQRVVHIQGDKEKIGRIVHELFELELKEVASKF